MMGAYDFCGHYEWTFGWIERRGGQQAVLDYWERAIGQDSQAHAAALIGAKGIAGMLEYWGATLAEESPDRGYFLSHTDTSFRIDMHDCPSRGFLVRNRLRHFQDYCDHCIGWIGPMLRSSGYTIDHEHNHAGQCWWLVRPIDSDQRDDPDPAAHDVRDTAGWAASVTPIDRFIAANSPTAKLPARTGG
jgi:hypothetical protein